MRFSIIISGCPLSHTLQNEKQAQHLWRVNVKRTWTHTKVLQTDVEKREPIIPLGCNGKTHLPYVLLLLTSHLLCRRMAMIHQGNAGAIPWPRAMKCMGIKLHSS